MSKLKAFTVLEVLITMGVMSIIISLTYFLYQSFTQQTFIFQKNLTESQQFEKFLTLIKRDFYESEQVVKTENGFQILFYKNKENIDYKTNKNVLIRTQNSNKIELEVQNLEFQTLEKKPNLISKINFKGKLFDQFLTINLLKTYPPNYSMEF